MKITYQNDHCVTNNISSKVNINAINKNSVSIFKT